MAGVRDRPGIGFIGMGAMGSRMARRLFAAGYPLTIYNRTPAKTQPLAAQDAQTSANPRALAACCDIIMLCLADDMAVKSVFLGSDGILADVQPGAVCIDFSTIAPATSRAIVEAGTLTMFVGGEAATYQCCSRSWTSSAARSTWEPAVPERR